MEKKGGRMKTLIVTCMLCAAIIFSVALYAQNSSQELIQIALLLDTSNSMDGLINQAKSQLWKIVNEFALMHKNGKAVRLQIALYEYGNSAIPSSAGYIRRVVELTGDLDRISEELFRLTTNGGDEYCGEVIDKAVKDLEWSTERDVLKIIFIAGNEPFTQGSYDYRKSCKQAIAYGIIINTIFCGNREEGINTSWKDGADLADGVYSNIDQNRPIAYITAPQDAEINKLGQEMNKTYLAYGTYGKKAKVLQAEQDSKAGSLADEVLAQRSVAKASAQYSNDRWDLVDASKKDSAFIDRLDKEQLPEEMRDMSVTERRNYLRKKEQERRIIQRKINTLNVERRKYIADQQRMNANGNTLDQALLRAIRKQAQQKHYVIE
jgi:hypothetical protein